MSPEKAPKSFDKETYEEALGLIKEHRKSFKADAESELARLCGGKELEAAIDAEARPPCTDDYDCGNCWLNEQCVHEEKTIEQRMKEMTKPESKPPAKKEEEEKKEEDTTPIDTKQLDEGMEDIL